MSKFRISRKKYSLSLTHGAAATTASTTADLNGVLSEIIIKTPAAVDAGATATVNIIDSDTNTIYTKATLAANATSINLLTNDLKVPICGTVTVQVVFSAAQTATDTVTVVTLLIDRGC